MAILIWSNGIILAKYAYTALHYDDISNVCYGDGLLASVCMVIIIGKPSVLYVKAMVCCRSAFGLSRRENARDTKLNCSSEPRMFSRREEEVSRETLCIFQTGTGKEWVHACAVAG